MKYGWYSIKTFMIETKINFAPLTVTVCMHVLKFFYLDTNKQGWEKNRKLCAN